MRTLSSLAAVAAAAAVTALSAGSAQASHQFFGDATANGILLNFTPGGSNNGPGPVTLISTLPNGDVLFQIDVYAASGTETGTINIDFSEATIADFSTGFTVGTFPGTTLSFTRNFSSSVTTNMLVDIPGSNPDFRYNEDPANNPSGTNTDTYTYVLNVQLGASAAAPEPATLALLGVGMLGGIAARRRKQG